MTEVKEFLFHPAGLVTMFLSAVWFVLILKEAANGKNTK